MKLLIDMNLSPRWEQLFADAGYDAVHWSRAGDPSAPDTEIMRFAANDDRVVLTHDLDFGSILAATQRDAPSVVQLRTDDVSPEAAGAPVLSALSDYAAELEDGALLTIDPARLRVTLLPIRR